MELLGGRLLVTEEMPFLYYRRYFVWNALFPAAFADLNFGQDVTRENIHDRWVVTDNRAYITVFHQMGVEISQIKRYLQIGGIDPDILR